MNNVVKTQFAGKNPFKPKRVFKTIDVNTLRITADKPKKRGNRNCKYDEIFKDLEVGKSISCKSEDADKVSQALRGYIDRTEKPWKVKTTTYYTKNTGRIFVLPKEES